MAHKTNKLRPFAIHILAIILATQIVHASKSTTIWSGKAEAHGSWKLVNSNHARATFRPTGKSGKANIVINYKPSRLDISKYIYTAVDVSNATNGQLDVTVSVLSNSAEAWSNQQTGRFILQPNENQPLRVFMLREELGDQSPWVQHLGNLYAFPGGHQRHWRFLKTDAIERIHIQVAWKRLSGDSNEIRIGIPYGDQAIDTSIKTLEALPRPLVDSMGQLRSEDWHERACNSESLTKDGIQDITTFAPTNDMNAKGLSRFGGLLDGPKLEATGRFHAKRLDDKWWLIDPEGHLFWSLGVTEAGIGSLTRYEQREALFPELAPRKDEDLWFMERGKTLSYSFYNSNLKTKYGDNWRDKHYQVTEGRMRTWGLNSIGAWSMEPCTVFDWKKPTLPYTVIVHTDLNGGIGRMHEMIDPFSKQFDQSLNSVLASAAKHYNGDPNNIGVFVNNELHWWGGIEHPFEVLTQSNNVPAKQALIKNLKQKYGAIENLNTNWDSNFSSFLKIKADHSLRTNEAFVADLEAFYSEFADTFFSKCREAINKHFPDHMYLGCRFNVFPPTVTRAASKHCDVMSFNLYVNSVADFKVATDIDRPFLISEFHFGTGSDGVWGRGLTPCADQNNQDDLYRAYVEDALTHPNFIGAHWFTWSDQPVTGRFDGENFRVGLVSIVDRPHQTLIKSIRATAESMYEKRLKH